MGDETDKSLEKRMKATTSFGFSGDTRVKASLESLKILNQPISSPHLASEIAQAGKGLKTEVTDSWKINTLKRKNHPWYDSISRVEVNPESRILQICLESEQFAKSRLYNPESLYRFKQDIYEFMLAVFEQSWTEPYRTFVDSIECTCISLEIDAFKGRSTQPLVKAEISLKELATYANGFYNAGELKTTLLFGKLGDGS